MIQIKFFLIFVLLSVSIPAFSQMNAPTSKFFVQTKLENTLTKTELNQLKSELSLNPNVFMVRVDDLNYNLYLITNELNTFNEQSFKSWLTNDSIYSCYHQGIHSLDEFKPFNEQFCEN